MKIINMTPHTINPTEVPSWVPGEIPPSGRVARVDISQEEVSRGFFLQTNGQITGLPAPQEGTLLAVSMAVRLTASHRWDLISPGEAIRDEHGHVIGCKGFAVNPAFVIELCNESEEITRDAMEGRR